MQGLRTLNDPKNDEIVKAMEGVDLQRRLKYFF